MLESLFVLGVGVAAAAAVHLAERSWPRLFHRHAPVLTWAMVAASVAGAVVAPPTPTGIDGVDALYRGVFALVVTLAAGRARRNARLVAGAAAAVGSAGAWPWTLAAFAALGLATGSATIHRPARPLGVAIGALQVQALLRLAWPDVAYGTAALAGLAAVVLVVSGVRHARAHERRPARLVLGALGAAGFVVAASLAVGLLVIQDDLRAGARSADAGLVAVRAGDTAAAVEHLARAEHRIESADDGLRAAWVRPARYLPVAGRYLDAGRDLTEAALGVLGPALRSGQLADGDALRIVNAQVDLDTVAELEPPLEQTLAAVPDARAALAAVRAERLPDSLERDIADLDATLARTLEDGEVAMTALDLLPELLGADGPRRWFVAMQTPAEQRASGGLVGSYGVLVTHDGGLELVKAGVVGELVGPGEGRQLGSVAEEYRRFEGSGPEEYFQNVTSVPHFPTVGHAIAQLYPQAGGEPVDGVISVDPAVLAALLSLTGPIEVPSWPEPLTAGNVERVLLHDQYVALEGAAASQLIVDAVTGTFQRLRTTTLPPPFEVVSTLAPLVDAQRLKLWSPRPAEQALFADMGATGAMPEVDGDFFQVVTQNSGESKIDWFQERTVDYDVSYDPVTGRVDAVATVTITNRAPAEGLPRVVIGDSYDDPGPEGRSRLWVDFYSALDLEAVTIDGARVGLFEERAYGRNLYWTGYTLLPGETVTFELYLTGLLDAGAAYQLDLGMQPVINPDEVTVSVRLPDGASAESADALAVDDGVASATFEQHEPRRFRLDARP